MKRFIQRRPPINHKTKGGFSWPRALVIVAALFVGGLALTYQPIGELALLIYGVFAFVRRLYSQVTFIFALIMFICIPIVLALGDNTRLASAFASYTYILLTAGCLCLVRELRAWRRNADI